jgi:multicomponent Na+:H+ antiporter subunit D
MTSTLVMLFAGPLIAAALSVLAWRRRAVQRALTTLTLAGMLATTVALVPVTRGGGVIAARVGAWAPGLAIVVAVDLAAALVLVLMLVLAAAALVLAALRGEDGHPLLHPLALVLVAGVALAMVTADLFNLFVSFEVLLIASYVLLTLRAGPEQVRAGVVYVAVNLLASTLFLLGVGLLYAVTGTVETARLAGTVADDPAALAAFALIVVAVATKAGLVPLHAWLPRAYVHASPAVTALFSGLLTKVGVFVLYRLTSLVLADVGPWAPLMLVVATVTMVVGVLGGLGGKDVRGILSYHMVSQIGYVMIPLGLWSVGAVTAGLVYLLHNMAVKGALFLGAGAIESITGTGRLDRLGGLARRHPWLAVGFLVPAFALAGVPPSSGFVSKYLVVLAAFREGAPLVAAVAVVVSLFTLMSMVKILDGAFWGERGSDVPEDGAPAPAGLTAMIGLTLAFSVATVAVGLGAGWLVALASDAARTLVDPTAYVTAVLGA